MAELKWTLGGPTGWDVVWEAVSGIEGPKQCRWLISVQEDGLFTTEDSSTELIGDQPKQFTTLHAAKRYCQRVEDAYWAQFELPNQASIKLGDGFEAIEVATQERVAMLQQLNRTLELLSGLDVSQPAVPCVEKTRSRVLETIAAICTVFVAIKVDSDAKTDGVGNEQKT